MKLRAVEACQRFHDLLFYRQGKLGSISKQLAAIERVQIEFIGVDRAALLAVQIDPVQQCFFGLGKIVLAVPRTLFLKAPKQIIRQAPEDDGYGPGSKFSRAPWSNAGERSRTLCGDARVPQDCFQGQVSLWS